MSFYWQLQLAVILLNSNYAAEAVGVPKFDKYIELENGRPIVTYWNQYTDNIKLLNESVYLELKYTPSLLASPAHKRFDYIVKSGDIKLAFAYAEEAVQRALEGGYLYVLNNIAEAYKIKGYIQKGYYVNWDDPIEKYFENI